MFYFFSFFNCKLPFSEKFTFRSKVQNIESPRNHCLHHEIITLPALGNSDPGYPTFLRLVSVTLESYLNRYRVTTSNTGRG